MLKRLGFWILLFSTICTTAQNPGIRGVVVDGADSEPLISASVYIPEIGIGTVTDEEGRFELSAPPGTYDLVVRFIGYSDHNVKVTLTTGWTELSIEMWESSIGLGSVVVTASKFEQRMEEVTVSIEILKPELLENKNSRYIDQAINQSPGIAVIDDQVAIRGGSGWSLGAGTRVMSLVDGIPLISGDAGQIQWEMIPVENIHQMEIIKGANSALYGSSAMNGVINIRTQFPGTEPETKFSIYQGLYGKPARPENEWSDNPRGYTGLSLLHTRRIGDLDVVAGLFILHDQGYQMDIHDHRQRVNVGLRYRPEKVDGLVLGLNANVMNKSNGNFLIWNGPDAGYIPLDSNATLTSGVNYYVDPRITYSAGKHHHDLKARFFDINNKSQSQTEVYDNFSEMLYLEYQYQYRWREDLTLTTGSMFNGLHSDGTVFGGEHRSRNISLYAQWDHKIHRFSYSLGVRYEYFDLDGWTQNRPVFRSGINYQLHKASWLRASFGQGFRYPSISEKYTFTSVGSVFVYPNAVIEPEYGYSAEIGIKQGLRLGQWKGYVDLAFFAMRYDNMMEFTFGLWEIEGNGTPSTGLGFTSVNIGPAMMRGIEMSVIGEGEIRGTKVRLISGYTYMDPRILYPDSNYSSVPVGGDQYFQLNYKKTSSDTSGILKYRFRHLFKTDIQADRGRWGAGLSVRYNSFMENIDLYLENLYGIKEARSRLNNGDLIFDLRLQYHINEHWRVAFLIDNLLNREYMPRPAMYGQPRTFSIQLNAQL